MPTDPCDAVFKAVNQLREERDAYREAIDRMRAIALEALGVGPTVLLADCRPLAIQPGENPFVDALNHIEDQADTVRQGRSR